jgi:hypothetical protein
MSVENDIDDEYLKLLVANCNFNSNLKLFIGDVKTVAHFYTVVASLRQMV